jgi:hypothetical protein
MAIHPLGAALSFKADDPVEAALQGAFLYQIPESVTRLGIFESAAR